MSKYTPSTETIRWYYIRIRENRGINPPGIRDHGAEFDRWLAEHDREAIEKVEAERDAALSTIAKVEALHWEVFDTEHGKLCNECSDWGTDTFPAGQMVDWPCPTLLALGSVPSTEEGNE